ncbi:rRNA N-glycosidase [Hordeum vulgare]|nr:rRNA N-glycosidase [Hordeum vulgare]
MTTEEEEELVRRVMEDSINTHDEAKWEGLKQMIALSGAGDVAIPEYDAVVQEEAMEGVQHQHEGRRPCRGTPRWSARELYFGPLLS